MPLSNVLNQKEIIKFDKKPNFNQNQKDFYFKVPEVLINGLDNTNKIIITLMHGYFRATHKFFINLENDSNLLYIATKLGIIIDNLKITLSKSSFYRYKQIIKNHFQIQEYNSDIQSKLLQEAIELAKNFTHRKKIFYSLVNLSKKLNIEIPCYTELARIVTVAINSPKKEVLKKLKLFINDDNLKILDDFLDKNEDYDNRYNITTYKKLEHSTRTNKMRSSVYKVKDIKFKFNATKEIIHKIGITPKIAEYYSRWIDKSKFYQLKRKNDIETSFLLLCFVYYQYLIRNDNLIDRFINIVQSAKTSINRLQKDGLFEIMPKKDTISKGFEESNINNLLKISKIAQNVSLEPKQRLESIIKLVNERLKLHSDMVLKKEDLNKYSVSKYDLISKKSKSLQGQLSEVLKIIEFDTKNSNKNLLSAITYFRDNYNNINSKAPVKFLTDEEKDVLLKNGFKISLYKALLFMHISDSLKNGSLNLIYSYKYKNFEEYLIPKDKWDKNKDNLLKQYELEELKDYSQFIKPIKEKLEDSYKETNLNIEKGLNSYFIAKDDCFILKTPKVEKDETIESISKYLPTGYYSIIDILNSVNKEVDIMPIFKHYTTDKGLTDNNLLNAAILGYGCNMNITKIAKISKGINESNLDTTKTWYFSVENTIEANEKIVQYIDNLELVKLIKEKIIHTSSDGQKYNLSSSIDSTNAGYSYKYFGNDKGLVAYTFIDNTYKLFHSQVINVNERESGYVIDGLLLNETVKSDIHSTDTHGFSEIIFGMTHLLGISFAPRIKNFKHQHLYSFKYPKEYKQLNYQLKPKRKIKDQLLKDNWDDILRFITTIKSRYTTASQLLKRLTSYNNHHILYSALKEFGKIIKTDFLLNYINDVELRQIIEKQLNKVESSNKFAKAVFFGNNQEFQISTIEEQNIANNCKRLIQNSIILWNYLYLTKKIQQSPKEIKEDILTSLKNSSIMHWSHINFHGEYDFTKPFIESHCLIEYDKTKSLM